MIALLFKQVDRCKLFFAAITFILSAICLTLPTSVSADEATSAQAPKTIDISTEEYPPYTSFHLNHFGIDSHIVSEAFRLEGIDTKYHFFPGARSFDMAKRGEVDARLPWAKRPGREKDFFYSEPVIKVDIEQLFFRQGFRHDWDPMRRDYRDLAGLRIAAIISYNYGEKFQSAEASKLVHVERVRDLKIAFLMLLNNRVDMVISKERVADHALQSNFQSSQISQIQRIAEHEDTNQYDYLLFSRRSPNAKFFLEAYNRGLKKLKEGGLYDKFLADLKAGKYIKAIAAK